MESSRKIFLIIIEIFISLMVITRANDPTGPPIHKKMRTFSEEMPRELPCPNPLDIQPCECSFDESQHLNIDCSNITSEEELKTVFSNYFPFPDFYELNIECNNNMTALRVGDLSNCTFKRILITECQLSILEPLALMSSYDTLEYLDLSYNRLDSIPDISVFKRLTQINVFGNSLTEFPFLNSSSLSFLSLSGNQIENIPVDALYGMPGLETVFISLNSISEILPETFTHNENLNDLQLSHNKLSTIPVNAIKLYNNDSDLYLNGNQITHIPVGAISGVNYWFEIEGNKMTELNEEVWRPLLEDNVELTLRENPFGCGCDIAWLITNRTLLDQLYDTPTCYDGEAFVDLDPVIYEALC